MVRKTTKQQKKKNKTAISVWALHDLQEQACPSDLFLFYPDVEEEIEHATAAKLEEFIVMKTKLINNSVSKWANWATSKVKPIIEWIETGGKNNRAALERLEKNIETISDTKLTRNHRRKRRKRTVQYITHWDRCLWVVLYPLRTTCTDHWGGSYIYSNSRN